MKKYYVTIHGEEYARKYAVIEACNVQDALYKAVDKYGLAVCRIMTEHEYQRSPIRAMGFKEIESISS